MKAGVGITTFGLGRCNKCEKHSPSFHCHSNLLPPCYQHRVNCPPSPTSGEFGFDVYCGVKSSERELHRRCKP